MLGAIYVGLSGLSAYSNGLQQVSNNVSNLNSAGFKGSSVRFRDFVSENGGGEIALAGGTRGAGNGVTMDNPQIDFGQGELRQTERDLDLAIDGSGFLVLMRDGDLLYSRTGSFEVDPKGEIVLAGTRYGLAVLDDTGRAKAATIEGLRINPPLKTSTIIFADNLSSTATSYKVSDVAVHDAEGTRHVWQVDFAREEGSTEWAVTVTDETGRTIGTSTLRFSSGLVDPATSKLDVADSANGLVVTLDFSRNVSSFSSGTASTLRASEVDGHGIGAVAAVRVNEKGMIEIAYTNEQTVDLGPVAIADFTDPQALQQRSGGLFGDPGDGGLTLTQSEDRRVGQVLSRRLEASNVDLAAQFGELILIQRGFQASSQIISVSNDMLQQLFGIRGQG